MLSSSRTERRSLTSRPAVYGKFFGSVIISYASDSIVMELADDGDAYQKIVESQANKIYLKEKMVWKTLI